MVLYIMKYNIIPEKLAAYGKWAAESGIPRVMEIPGLVEFRGYRPASGTHHIAATYEFKDMASWAAWMESPDYRKLMEDFLPFVANMSAEVWGASPVVPDPLRPKK